MNTIKNISNVLTEEKTTHQGGYAYKTTFEDDLCTLFTIGSLHGRFYEDATTAIKDMDNTFKKALNECPELATKYAVYSAETLRMKLIPTLWLVYISTLEDKTLFNKAFPRIIGTNIKMLHDFIEICRTTNIRPGGHMSQKVKQTNRGIGSSIKKTINTHLNKIMNDYNVTRFTGKLEDICHLTRIKDNESNVNYLKYIFKPKNNARRLTFERAILLQDTIDILSKDERAEDEFKRALENIAKAKIQMDEIKFTFGKLSKDELQKVYEHFLPTLSYAALVTNLSAIERVYATSWDYDNNYFNGSSFKQKVVLETDIPKHIVDLVAKRLSDVNSFLRSGLFFMRLYIASKMIVTTEWSLAMNKVFKEVANKAFDGIPETMRVRCSADTSGSMSSPITNNSKVEAIDVAAYLTAACALSIPSANAYATATYTKQVNLKSTEIEQCAEAIKNTDVGYGTYFESLLKGYKGENIVLLITDTQQSSNVNKYWKQLNNKPNDAKFIIWDIVGYAQHNVISNNDPSFIYIRGYSDRNLQLVNDIITGKAGQKEVVHQVVL